MKPWILFSFIAAVATSFIVIIIKYLKNNSKIELLEFYMFILFFVISLCLALYLLFNKKKVDVKYILKNKKIIPCIFLLAILAIISVYFSSKAHMFAPNPGYSLSVINFNMVIVLLLCAFLFKSHLNVFTITGVALVFLGVILIALNSDNKRKK